MKQTTQQNYRQRILKVVEYIWANIEEDLDTNTLADVAHFSPYHFHRIYREMMQETVASSVRRLRLHYATYTLLHTDRPIAEIARSIRYGSAEAFIRAFAKSTGQTPALYRQQRQQAFHTNAFDHQATTVPRLNNAQPSSQENPMFTIEITSEPEIKLAGLAHHGNYMDIGKCFERLCSIAGANQMFTPTTRSLGIYYDDPQSTPVNELRSHACISIEQDSQLPEQLENLSLSAGRYAVLKFKGPYAELESAYRWFYGTWLPTSGHEPADKPPFEEYLNDPKEVAPQDLLTAIYLPLAG
jgi:AraC family transcriptional regulator|tara:strand:+ start:1385 stop:2281 length:897 start_codon:yes stop_codon:yes gene_type:complete